MTTYTCPVCGFDQLDEPPARFSICPSCGTEFENDDYDVSHAELRRRWIAAGARWWSAHDPIPDGWSPVDQLRRSGYDPTIAELWTMVSSDLTTLQNIRLKSTSGPFTTRITRTSTAIRLVITSQARTSYQSDGAADQYRLDPLVYSHA